MQKRQKSVAIIGAGAAGLMAADRLSQSCPDLVIKIYDAMPSPARKFLMAGKSGLNISHQSGISDPEGFAARYGKASDWMRPMLQAFGTPDILRWMESLGQEYFVGSSNRIFPKAMKASPLLRALMKRLESRGVTLAPRHRWIGWREDGQMLFATAQGERSIAADACLLSLGGPSWPRLGTDGAFLPVLAERGVSCHPYRPANCGFTIRLPESFDTNWAGEPLQSVGLSFADQAVHGGFVLSLRAGESHQEASWSIEGGAIYALSARLRDAIENEGSATLSIDLRPNISMEQIKERLNRPRGKQSLSNHLRRSLKLQGVQAALLKALTDKHVMNDIDQLATAIKALPITLTSPRPIAEAISTAGGVALEELNENMMVRRMPGLFMAGEMLDWEAPTGGYLLTGCLSQGHRAALGMASYLETLG
ncbi:TIGR03862 family flavoprotein [uncultured Cohaesibacter sp.]|uniref:TIGR03862 family flavoprotein n=1 Tax=uncultured Cohaesibacter sp. TaxID=1002546 RepID=UPI0029C8D71D|nr:TIGR03862 family flavoprotein [uncultured Cohaesibacter sp.]